MKMTGSNVIGGIAYGQANMNQTQTSTQGTVGSLSYRPNNVEENQILQ